jgi:hypothetical protein
MPGRNKTRAIKCETGTLNRYCIVNILLKNLGALNITQLSKHIYEITDIYFDNIRKHGLPFARYLQQNNPSEISKPFDRP